MDFIIYSIWPDTREWVHEVMKKVLAEVSVWGSCFPIYVYTTEKAKGFLQKQESPPSGYWDKCVFLAFLWLHISKYRCSISSVSLSFWNGMKSLTALKMLCVNWLEKNKTKNRCYQCHGSNVIYLQKLTCLSTHLEFYCRWQTIYQNYRQGTLPGWSHTI